MHSPTLEPRQRGEVGFFDDQRGPQAKEDHGSILIGMGNSLTTVCQSLDGLVC